MRVPAIKGESEDDVRARTTTGTKAAVLRQGRAQRRRRGRQAGGAYPSSPDLHFSFVALYAQNLKDVESSERVAIALSQLSPSPSK